MSAESSADFIARWKRLSPEKRRHMRQLMKDRAVKDIPILPRLDFNGPLPLSFSQQRLWFLDQLAPGNAFYNMHSSVRLPLAVDVKALERSLSEIVRRHESLRTTFVSTNGHPAQVVAEHRDVRLPVVDLTTHPSDDREAELVRVATEQARLAFDLARGPLLRQLLVRIGGDDFVLLLTMHHIVSDGWSLEVLFRELSALYDSYTRDDPSPLPALPVQYPDFALWQREWLEGEVLQQQLDYWRVKLQGAPLLELPTDRPRPKVISYAGATCEFTLTESLVHNIEALQRSDSVTPFMITLAAFAVLLSRYSGQDEVVIGCPTAGRHRPELENLIGFFVNSLVLRLDLSGDATFGEVLNRVKDTALEAYAHADLPFERLVEELHAQRDPSRNPLFQVSFQLTNLATSSPDGTPAQRAPAVQRDSAVFDLAINLCLYADRADGVVEYSSELFDESSIERLIHGYLTLLDAAVQRPNLRLFELPLLDRFERQQLLYDWNDTAADYAHTSRVHELVERAAAMAADSCAVSDDGAGELTFAQLDRGANVLARGLRAHGAAPGDRIAIALERSGRSIVAQLACWKAGCAFVPLDLAAPDERLAYQLSDAGVRLLITNEDGASRAGTRSAECLHINDPGIWDYSSEPLVVPGSSADLAYVIYTSGSTGAPKGVEIVHRSLVNLIAWHERAYEVSSRDRASWVSAPAFDASIWEVWPYLAAGASVHIAADATRDVPATLLRWLVQRRISIAFLPTPLAEVFLQMQMPALLPLRAVLTGGDRLRQAPERALPFRLFNNYGPTENTVVTTWTEVRPLSTGMPAIGRPIDNNRLYVLDPHGTPQPIGVPGELYVGGASLARGYRNRPDLTRDHFVTDPFRPGERVYRTGDLVRYRADGNLEFVGRVDRQIKLRGFRIELEEIEAVLRGHPAVEQCVVEMQDADSSVPVLVAYVVLGNGSSLDSHGVREFVARRLPAYMLPGAVVFLDALPLSRSGKIDRSRLPAPKPGAAAQGMFVAPRDDEERRLATIWQALLPGRRCGVTDNFFDLGGHSLIAVQLVSRIQEQWSIDFPLIRVFEQSTIAEQAAELRLLQATPVQPGIPVRQRPDDRGHSEGLTDDQVDVMLRELLAPAPSANDLES